MALDPSNHGTLDANAACQEQCSAADWQQAAGSHFLHALNSFAETFAGIDYTVIYSRTDEVVVPNTSSSGSSSLHSGAGKIENIAVQQVCPTTPLTIWPWGLSPGGLRPGRGCLRPRVAGPPAGRAEQCVAEPFQPGVDPSTFASNYGGFLAEIGRGQESARQLSAEPPLDCYVFASCRLTGPSPSPPPIHLAEASGDQRRYGARRR